MWDTGFPDSLSEVWFPVTEDEPTVMRAEAMLKLQMAFLFGPEVDNLYMEIKI